MKCVQIEDKRDLEFKKAADIDEDEMIDLLEDLHFIDREQKDIDGVRELQQEIFGTWDKDSDIVLYDHDGAKCLDATAFIIGHGFTNVHALAGGIDAYSQQVDPSLPRYRLELD